MRKVKGRVESAAEHTFSLVLLALEIMQRNKLKLDELKVLKMLAYHELGEIEAGDITPFDNITVEEKFDREYKCIKRLSKQYKMPEIETLWLEYSENKTPEAMFCNKVDKLDAVLQSKEYAKINKTPELFEEFYINYKTICDELFHLKF